MNSYSSDAGAVQPGRQPTDIERLRTMEPEVKEKDIQKILEKVLQNNGIGVIFKNEDAIAALGLPVQDNSEKVKETLRQFENVIKDCKTHEIGVVVRPDGELVCAVRGIDKQVSVPEEWLKDNVFTHNHPEGGYALSVQDVCNFVDHGLSQVRSVTHDKLSGGLYTSLVKIHNSADIELGANMLNRFPNAVKLFLEADRLAVGKHGRNRTAAHIRYEQNKLITEWLRKNALPPDYIFSEGVLK